MSGIEIEGLTETLKAFQGLERDIRRQANGELRRAASQCALGLVSELRASAAGSGVPVAPRVASSAKVKNDRMPSVSVGGSRRVGRRGASASRLMWGSEHGGHNFAAGPSGGYWIKPAVDRFKSNRAVTAYKTAVAEIMRRYGLL